MSKKKTATAVLALSAATVLIFIMCVCLGSVSIPLRELLSSPIIASVRLPRVVCAVLAGASLSLAGASMQGLLKNPLADGSTMGISSGAALGAVTSIAFGISFPGLPFAGTAVMASIGAFASLAFILVLAYRLDHTLSSATVILLGVIFSMFASGMTSVLITFASDQVRQITFWTMGSLQSATLADDLVMSIVLTICAFILISRAGELNAFAVGEDNASSIGVDIKKTRLTVLITVSVVIGVCVSFTGTIGFVGLVTPHMVRIVCGPDHKRLLPVTMLAGACFMMLSDLIARTLLSPKELPVGVVTSIIGSVVFIVIYARRRLL